MGKLLSEIESKFNPNATKEDCILDLRNLQLQYPEKEITRNFYRQNGNYSDSTWQKHCGTFKEFKRQAELELTRHQHKLEKEIAKHAAFDHYVDFFQKEIMPLSNLYEVTSFSSGPIKKLMICGDLHDLHLDLFAWSVFVDQCKRIQPDIIVFAGDVFDLYEFSNFNVDPRQVQIVERFKFVKEKIFKVIREACPHSQIDFIMGNHEFRLLRHIADKTPFVRVLLSDVMGIGFAEIFGLHEFKINWISKVDFKAFSKMDIRNSLKENYRVYFDSFVVSHEPNNFQLHGCNLHHHKLEVSHNYSVIHGVYKWVSVPGLHSLSADYVHGPVKWDLGFNFVLINTKTKEVIQQPQVVHQNWAVVNGIHYFK